VVLVKYSKAMPGSIVYDFVRQILAAVNFSLLVKSDGKKIKLTTQKHLFGFWSLGLIFNRKVAHYKHNRLHWFAIYQPSKFVFCSHRYQFKLTQTLTQFDSYFIHPCKIPVSFRIFRDLNFWTIRAFSTMCQRRSVDSNLILHDKISFVK